MECGVGAWPDHVRAIDGIMAVIEHCRVSQRETPIFTGENGGRVPSTQGSGFSTKRAPVLLPRAAAGGLWKEVKGRNAWPSGARFAAGRIA